VGPPSTASAHQKSFEVRLPPQPSSVAAARGHVRDLLKGSERQDLAEPAVLLVSEIVTNALLHAGTEIDLKASVEAAGIRVEVGDGSLHVPSPRRYAATAGTGRGLMMLESMVDDWGVSLRPDGKTVWFLLSSADRARGDRAAPTTEGAGEVARDGDRVPVELQNMPLLLHAAWQEHAEALLREYLLANLEADGGSDPIQMHAEATDAIAVLEEHVPRASVRIEPEELMEGATEPHVTAPRIEVPVPRGSVASFETLDRAIEAALDMSREGLVLTPPTPPEVEAFRRWLVRQVVRQAAGRHPEPWEVPADPAPVPAAPPGWDPASVTEAEHGVIAANQASRIVAVSRRAAEILGYDEEHPLVGLGIVAIIPERFRQAHVAGFTMYLLVGRNPLLGRPQRLSALRRDGTEVEIELLVRDESLGEGRSVLLADIRPASSPS
jgi:PAS domain S-box-containing protein